jgi:hypothetical protein
MAKISRDLKVSEIHFEVCDYGRQELDVFHVEFSEYVTVILPQVVFDHNRTNSILMNLWFARVPCIVVVKRIIVIEVDAK